MRLYDAEGTGYYFIPGYGAGRWYYKSNEGDNHYTHADAEAVKKNIDAGGRVQLVGLRGVSFGVWDNFNNFYSEITKTVDKKNAM